MSPERREQLNAALARKEANLAELEAGIQKYEDQNALYQEYIDGKRKNPFDIEALRKEQGENWKHIATIRATMAEELRGVERVRRMLDISEIHETQHIEIHLTPKPTFE